MTAARRIGKVRDARDLGLKLIDDRLRQLAKLQEVARTDEFLAIANLMEQISVNCGSSGGGTPSLGEQHFEFSVYLSSLDRWTDERYTGAVFSLGQLEPDDSSMNEYKDAYNRDHYFTWKFEEGYEIRAKLYCYEKKETSECRRVQVGVKMVEQPIYKYDCVVPEGSAGELPPPVLNLEVL